MITHRQVKRCNPQRLLAQRGDGLEIDVVVVVVFLNVVVMVGVVVHDNL